MKVLNIIGSIDEGAGGPSRSVTQTCEQVSKQGTHIELICRLSPNPVNVKTSDAFKVTFRNLANLFIFSFSISKKKIKLIHLQHIWDPYIHVIAWIARIKGIPYIISPRGMLAPTILNQHTWKKKIALFLYQQRDLKKASYIHATSEKEKQNIRNLGFTNPLVIIPNGIDISLVPSQKTDFGSRKVVFLSRIHPQKGLEIMLESWKHISLKDWTLEIAGDGDVSYIKILQNKITQENIKNVIFLGSIYNEKKWDFLKSGDIFILPTYSESFGIAIAEALAVGIPVITTTGTPWEDLIKFKCGWWIDLNVQNLVNTINEAMNKSPKELNEMGLKGRKLIIENYEIKSVGRDMKAFYDLVINN